MSLRVNHSSVLNRALRSGIAERLRAAYQQTTKEEIPARQRDLLRQFERREQSVRRAAGKDAATARRH
jgi:Anti-sigma factor NepR